MRALGNGDFFESCFIYLYFLSATITVIARSARRHEEGSFVARRVSLVNKLSVPMLQVVGERAFEIGDK